MQETTRLKPCPFCGSRDVDYHGGIDDVYDHYRVVCFNCGAATAQKPTRTEADEAWNRRTNY